jgi:glycosyltransferase involved in cell wall biosynthesis
LSKNDSQPTESISFFIPFYSNIPYLLDAIESVRAQEHTAWTLVIVDDHGPEKEIPEIISRYSDPRISYVRNEQNLGMVGNWNRCLDLAKSDLVTLLHADDKLHPSYSSEILRLAAKNTNAAAFFTAAQIIDSQGLPAFSLPDAVKKLLVPRHSSGEVLLEGETALTALMGGNFIFCPALCYRKSKIGDKRFDPSWKQVQDLAFTCDLLLEGHTLLGSARRAYQYRRHSNNATVAQTATLLRFHEENRLFNQLAAEFSKRGMLKAANQARARIMMRLNLLYCALSDILHICPKRAFEKLHFFASTFLKNH